MTKPMIVIMAGGTGGHVFPALAVAQMLQQQGFAIAWLGTAQGLEATVIPPTQIPLYTLNIRGLRGKKMLQKLAFPGKFLHAIWQALQHLRQLQPIAVIGFGGYASGPGGIAAWLLRKPLIIHEQNAIVGLTNRILGKLAERVLQAFPNTFPASYKAFTTGNPVRTDLANIPIPTQRYQPRKPYHLLILGGSLGATAINQLVPKAIAQLSPAQQPLIWHQTGNTHQQTCLQHYQTAGLTAALDQSDSPINITAFIADMAAAYRWADLVICRAGALTIAELAVVGVASILIPFPYAVDDHQTYNARFLSDADAAVLLQQSTANPETLAILLQEYFSDFAKLVNTATRARNLGNPNATELVVKHCLEVSHYDARVQHDK